MSAVVDRSTPAAAGQLHAGVHHALLAADPEAVFLRGQAGDLRYGECLDWVARLSQHGLQACAGRSVAIWMDKGPLYAQCILAVLFAQARYLPLDGGQPLERVQAILGDADAGLLIMDAAHAGQWLAKAQLSRLRVLVIDDQPPVPQAGALPWLRWLDTGLRDLPPAAPLTPAPVALDAVAAILYTSGSTGTPKGVQLSHRNLLNFVTWAARTLSLDAGDRLLNLASFNFDLSTFDLFASLQVGASVYVSTERELRSMARLGELLADKSISVVYGVPSLYGLLLRSGVLQGLPRCELRRVIFAGEVMPKPLLQRLAQALQPGCALYNFYGPTETNVCLWHQVGPEDLESPHPVPIGLPIQGAQVWLQDEHGRRVDAEGALGEVWVSGDCVTPGYWRRPQDPNTPNHQRGCHATGDQGSWREGRLHYHGRLDRMLKIGGHRVELGEVEAALARHPQVGDCAVLGLPSESGPRLVAVIVPRDGEPAADALAMRQHCAQWLPAYMVPQQVQFVTALPRTANGKTDLRALRDGLLPGAAG